MESIYEKIENANEKDKYGHKLNLYKCKICGKTFLKRDNLTKNVKKCKHNDKNRNTNGLSKTRIYGIYRKMISRCYNRNVKDFQRYGGRGIIIYDEWLKDFSKFYNWAINNGYEENLTIDRINVNGNYEPNNCRWITLNENCTFKSTTKVITVNDESNSCNGWSRKLNKSKNYISTMLQEKGIEYTKNYIKENM